MVICALNAHSAARLAGRFDKEYLAIVNGVYKEGGTIDKPIYRPDPIKTYRTIDERGDYAITHYEPEEVGENYTVVRVRLETGRTHQIRVHMSYTGHALLGDEVYSKNKTQFEKKHPQLFSGQALHAKRLTLTHPKTGERMTFECDLPTEFEKALDLLRKEQN